MARKNSAPYIDPMEAAYAMARERLGAYAIAIHPNYCIYPHHRRLIEKLEAVERGEVKRLIVTMPPRHGKSLTATKIFPSWWLGRHPADETIIASYGSDLARDFGRYVRNALSSDMHQAIFPDCVLSPDSTAQSRFNTTEGGGLIAVGRGGTMTGRGGKLILLDDLFKDRKEADNLKLRDAVWQWWQTVVRTRLAPGGAIVATNTRWHEDDHIGRLMAEALSGEGEPWEILDLPAIDDEGEALWPEMFPVPELMKVKAAIGSRAFEALYQQRPTPAEGGMIKRAWIQFYRELPSGLDYQLQSWDTTFKGSDGSDFVVGQCWGAKGADAYLIDQVRGRMDFPTALAALQTFSAKHPKAHTKLIEEKANGAAIIATMKHKVGGIIPVVPKESKTARLSAAAPAFEAGNIHLPHPDIAPWVHDYIEELVSFPTARHDDQVDATTQAIERIRGGSMTYLDKLVTL